MRVKRAGGKRREWVMCLRKHIQREGDTALGDFCDPPKSEQRKRKRPSSRAAALRKARDESGEMRAKYQKGNRQAFDEAEPRHMVGLYSHMHEAVYGVAPLELSGAEDYMGAVSAARKLLHDEFDDSQADMVKFLRWIWQRERGREKWRRENKREGSRIGWRLMFQKRHLVTDFRAEQARRKGQA